MPIRQTQIECYKSIRDHLGPKQQAVYEALCLKPMTNSELADFLHWPINCCTGRTHELTEAGLVKYSGTKIHPLTHKRQILWAVVDRMEAGQLRLF